MSQGSIQIEVEFDADENIPGTRPSIAAQMDRISIVQDVNGNFAPPLQNVPEPAALSMLGLLGIAALRRNRA
jgi:hypothetical protein